MAIGGALVLYPTVQLSRFAASAWNVYFDDEEHEVASDQPTTPVYDTIAPEFDEIIEETEWWLRIGSLRKELAGKCAGDVLEVAVGTGRNCEYFDLERCTSVTMIDESGPMLDIARQKWKDTTKWSRTAEWREAAASQKTRFYCMNATDDIPRPATRDGYTAILSTFSLCSMPHPAETLAHLCTLLSSPSSTDFTPRRVFLLEHGKSNFDWLNKLLDKTAHGHAGRFGCWWNRDIGAIAEEAAQRAGMEIVETRRKHFGTTWVIEMRPKPGVWQKQKNHEASSSSSAKPATKSWSLWR